MSAPWRREENEDEVEPLNFDHEAPRVRKKSKNEKSYMSPSDLRGDDEGYQYYEEEEALSPEEAKLRKQEGNL